VVLSMASIALRQGTMSWLGIGNVVGIVYHANGHGPPREELLVRPGVLGYGDLAVLQASAIPLRPRDVLIFATDGINRHFSEGLAFGASAQPLADYIIAHHSQRNDDALVVVARAS